MHKKIEFIEDSHKEHESKNHTCIRQDILGEVKNLNNIQGVPLKNCSKYIKHA